MADAKKSEFESFVGFDLDGTLAKRPRSFKMSEIGDPIPAMIKKLREHLKDGDTVKIFTARAHSKGATKPIHAWLKEQGLPKLEVTNVKTPGLQLLYDDRAVSVRADKGIMKRATTKAASAADPERIGKGLGTLVSDMVPLLPSGARRAGAAEMMAARIGRKPSWLVSHPIATQAAALVGGGGLAHATGFLPSALLPILVVQLLRRRELNSIQDDYASSKRMRLRDLPGVDDMLAPSLMSASQRLGRTQTYETMRRRKFQGVGPMAEASDALMLTAGPVASPIISLVDNMAATKLRKAANWAHEREMPVAPLYLAAGAGTLAGKIMAHEMMKRELASVGPMPKEDVAPLVKHIAGSDPLVARGYGDDAFHVDAESVRTGALSVAGETPADIARAQRDGMVVVSPHMSRAPIVAHEAGHARNVHNGGLVSLLQKHVYPLSGALAPAAGIGSMAAGLASGSTLRGAGLGTLIGGILTAGQTVPEAMASIHGLRGLGSYRGGALASAGDRSALMSALATYLTANILPSTLAGAAGGLISSQRK